METRGHDGTTLHYSVTGGGPLAVVFVHGWLGSGKWWSEQVAALQAQYTTVTLDLAGHGESGRERKEWSIEAYAQDIATVVAELGAKRVVLVGHSMSGANVLAAAVHLREAERIVLVDTIKDVTMQLPPAMIDQMLGMYRADFRKAVTEVAAQYLYSPSTPRSVIDRLTAEFLQYDGDFAAKLLAPFYRFDAPAVASKIKIPVRAIGGDLHPTNLAANQAAFTDYSAVDLPVCGHYPMLEQPAKFTEALLTALTN